VSSNLVGLQLAIDESTQRKAVNISVRINLEGHSFSRPPTSVNAEYAPTVSRLEACRCMEGIHIRRGHFES